MVYYSTSVFRSAGVTSDVAASALVGAANVFGLCLTIFLFEDWKICFVFVMKCLLMPRMVSFQEQLLHPH